jgi:hypothetical protein
MINMQGITVCIQRRICNSLKKADCVIMKLARAGERENNDVKKNKDWFQL